MIKVGQRSCWPKIRFISNRMKVEKVILEGLRRAPPVSNGLPSTAHEQQAEESRLRSRRRGKESISSIEDDHEDLGQIPRRHSSIFTELGRQASVLWNDDEHTEGEEDAMTPDGGDEEAPAHAYAYRDG
jgi:hypothetical protein